MHITVRSADVTHLRQVVMHSCKEDVGFLRVSPVDHARRMQVCVCIRAESIMLVMCAVMRALSQAELGVLSSPPSHALRHDE